jgi:hypothetical protein
MKHCWHDRLMLMPGRLPYRNFTCCFCNKIAATEPVAGHGPYAPPEWFRPPESGECPVRPEGYNA